MPLDSSIPLKSVAPDPMASLSSLLDVGTKSLSLQKNRATFDADVARSKADSSTAQSAATVNAANIRPLIDQQAAQTSSAQTKANSDAFGNRQAQVESAHQSMRELLTNGPVNEMDPARFDQEKVDRAIDTVGNYAVQNGHREQEVRPLFERMKAAKGPGGAMGVLKQTMMAQFAPQGALDALTQKGIGVTNGNQSYVANQAPLAGPVGGAVPGTAQTQQIPIANQQGVGSDVNGNPVVNNKDKFGNIQPSTQMPGTNAPPMMNYPAGESSGTKSTLEQEASVARSNASRGQEMHANNRGILEALKEVVATGPAGRGIAKLAGFAGIAADSIPGANAAEKAASAYDTIGKLTEKNALAAAAAMGNETNGKIEAQIKANGSAAYNPTALRNITMLNDALVTGSEKYAVGMQKSIEASGHVFGKRQFDREWAQNANVDTLKFLNAIKTKDTAEQEVLIKKAGEAGSPGRLKLMQELRNLQKLTQTGSL